MWAETSRALRDLLAPSGWRRLNDSNQALVVDPAERRGLIVATGDEFTGRLDGTPRTRSKKGPKTLQAVQRNAYLFPEWEEEELVSSIEVRETWILLIHRDLEAREVRSQLSLPILMDKERRIGGWSERILLPSSPFGEDGAGRGVGISDSPTTPEIVIEIKKRA
jgi:hypothetical protein